MTGRHIKAVIGVTIVVLVSKLLGMGREMAIAFKFGTSSEYDLYLIAIILPALAYGVINFASFYLLVPHLTKTLKDLNPSERETAWRKIWSLGNITILASVCVYGFIFIFSPFIMRVWASPGTADFERIVFFARLTGLVVILGTGEAFLRAVLNVHKIFSYPSGGLIVDNLVNIGAILFLASFLSVGAVAFGWVIGLVIFNIYLGLRLVPLGVYQWYKPTLRGSQIGILLPTAGVLIAIEILNRSYFLIDRYIAPTFGNGVVSALNYGQVLVQLPDAVFGFAIASVIFPLFAEIHTSQDEADFSSTYSAAIIGGLLLSVPLSIMFFVNAREITQLLFLRGEFNAISLDLTVNILRPITPVIIALPIVSTSIRAGYGRGWAGQVLWFTVFALVVKILGTLWLPEYIGYPGISTATAISQVIFASLLLGLCITRKHFFNRSLLGAQIVKILGAGILSLALLFLFSRIFFDPTTEQTTLTAVKRIFILGGILMLVYIPMIYGLGMGGYVKRVVQVFRGTR